MSEKRRMRRRASARAERRHRLLSFAAAVVGASILFYPGAAMWFSDHNQATSLETYAQIVDALPDEARTAAREAAEAYNAALPRGPLRDPFASRGSSGRSSDDYPDLLRMPGSDVMARVTIPSIDVSLPVYHGVGDDALDRGIGHLPGSSLPVGGPGTHAVLSAHSGLTTAVMLTDLEKVRIGDRFQVNLLGEDLTYEVDDISVVRPDESDVLRIEDGKDYVTLLTCTPTNVNTHRLLVRGVRVPDAPTPPLSQRDDARLVASFPWWAVGYLAVLGVSAALTLVPFRKGRHRRQRESLRKSESRPT